MSQTTVTIVISVLALVIAGYSIFKASQAGTPITLDKLEGVLQTSEGTAQEIATIVKAGVFAAEQLKSTGKLDSNNAAFLYALNFASKDAA